MMDSIFAVETSEKTERELLLDVQLRLQEMEKRQKRRGIIGWVAAVAIVLILAAALLFMLPKYQAFKAQYDAVSTTVQQLDTALEGIDLEGLTSAAEFLSSVNYEKLQELSVMLETMDTGKLSEQLESVTDLIDQLGELNTEALVSNINLIIEKLQPIMNWFK